MQIFNTKNYTRKEIMGVKNYSFEDCIDLDNVFINNNFDYDNFYMGKNSYISPVTNNYQQGTPEQYGRELIVNELLKEDLSDKLILDVGSGELNIYRELIKLGSRPNMFINLDISGPWSNPGKSSLEMGLRKLGKIQKPNVTNVEFDLNNGLWPFSDLSFDFVVSCMALHHICDQRKKSRLIDIYKSLKVGGKIIIVDYFSSENTKHIFKAGGGGPKICKGFGEGIDAFIDRAKKIGFRVEMNGDESSIEINRYCNYIILEKFIYINEPFV